MTRLILFLFTFLINLLFEGNTCLAQVPQKNINEKKKTSLWKVELKPLSQGKFKIEATVFSIGDPVHETLTLHSLINGGILPKGTNAENRVAAQFIRGVFWNDDPCAQLLSENDFFPLSPSFGVAWYMDFRKAQGQVKIGAGMQDMNCPLLGRSHFGDLQFLHGMAEHDGVKATITLNRMMAWARIAYRISINDIDPSKPLKTDPIAKSLLSSASEMSVVRLLRAKTKTEARARAFGSLLHMVQDSYAHGHVSRSPASAGEPAGIIQFLSYINQDTDKHAHDDSWVDGTDNLDRTLKIPGAHDALATSTKLVQLYKAREPWKTVESYLKNGPFYLRPDAKDSGPGDYSFEISNH